MMEALSDSCLGDDKGLAPGFRFHPTDEELVLYYLKRKICRKRLKAEVIGETDIYKWDPDELPAQSLYKTRDRQWFFFSPRDRKYPNGGRSSRATEHGYWKATGKDRIVTCNSRPVGVKKTLVFYRGRAPNGERTDWVMHEYTLDEEELKRCQNVKDYYVLYKLYKKSGPGPKNGEQYGAPFTEEEWADDDVQDVTEPADSDLPADQHVWETQMDNIVGNGLNQSGLDDHDIEELMRQVTEEPALPQPHVEDSDCTVVQVASEDTTGDVVRSSSWEVIFPKQDSRFTSHPQEYNEQAFFDPGQSASSALRQNEVPGVASAAETLEAVQLSEDGYLEINDLSTSKPEPSAKEAVQKNWDFDEFGDLDELDFFDVNSFFQDISAVDQESASHPCMDALGVGAANRSDQQLQLNNSSVVNPAYECQSQQRMGMNQVNCQPQFCVSSMGQISSGTFSQEHNNNLFTTAQSDEMPLIAPAPGAGCESINPLTAGSVNEEDGGRTDEVDESSQFAPSLWAFLDSVPTSPAFASENPLVNRAFERMSSFGRVSFTSRNTSSNNIVTVDDSAIRRRRTRGNNKGFFLLSILGALCAIFWLCVGAVGVSGRSVLS